MRRPIGRSVLLVVLVLVCLTLIHFDSAGSQWPMAEVSLAAQSTDTSALLGRVIDATGLPLADASVTVTSTALFRRDRRILTDERGTYRVTGLRAGVYQVAASQRGFATTVRSNVLLFPDATLTVDLQLELLSVEQRVEVDAPVAMIDVTTSAKPFRFDRLLLDNLPTDRNMATMMNLSPGINGSIGLGGVQQSNPLLVEGVNTTDVQTLGPWVSFNYNWLDDVQVVGPGAGAEYDDFSGVVQQARLRSGSDELRLTAEARGMRPRWIDVNTGSLSTSTQQNLQAQSQRILTSHDESVDIGGPLRRERIWGFGALQTVRQDWIPALYDGPDSVDTHDRRMLAKLDSAPAGAMRLGGFYSYDRHEVRGDGLSGFTPIAATSTDIQPDHTWNLDARWAWGSSTLSLTGSGAGGQLSFNPTAPATRTGPYSHYDVVTNMDSGNLWQFFDIDSRRTSVGANLTREQVISDQHHGFKLGAQVERSRLSTALGYPGGRAYLDQSGQPYLVYLWDGFASENRIHRAAGYVEDRWSLGRLTLEPGIRVTRNAGLVSQGSVLTTTALSPRFGVAWDVTQHHDTVVSAHVGRFFDALLTPNFAFADAQQQPPTITATVVGPDQFVELSRSPSSTNMTLDPDLSQAHFDEALVGVERTVSRTVSASAQLLTRRYRDFMGTIDTGSVYVPASLQDPGPDGKIGNADDGGTMTVYKKANPGSEHYVFTNPPGAYRDYTSFQLVARYRRMAAAEVQASYAWSRTRGNVDNTLRANSAGPELWTNGVFSDPNRAINSDGPGTFDFAHDVKLLGTWHASWLGGFAVSGVYRYHTGVSWARSVQNAGGVFAIYGVHVEPRGARQTPALNAIDLRLEKTFALGSDRRLGFFVDGFNLTNQGIPDPTSRRAVFEVSGPSFGVPLNWLAPRSARAGVRVNF